MEYPDHNMDNLGADNLSVGSNVSELVSSVQLALEQLVSNSESTPDGSYIVAKDVIANVLHAFTDLADAVDSITRDKSLTTSTPLSNDITKVLDRLGEIEKQIHRMQSTHQPHPPR